MAMSLFFAFALSDTPASAPAVLGGSCACLLPRPFHLNQESAIS